MVQDSNRPLLLHSGQIGWPFLNDQKQPRVQGNLGYNLLSCQTTLNKNSCQVFRRILYNTYIICSSIYGIMTGYIWYLANPDVPQIRRFEYFLWPIDSREQNCKRNIYFPTTYKRVYQSSGLLLSRTIETLFCQPCENWQLSRPRSGFAATMRWELQADAFFAPNCITATWTVDRRVLWHGSQAINRQSLVTTFDEKGWVWVKRS